MNNDRQNSGIFAFVPSYNHSPYIGQCLRSIIAQTLPPDRLLVIDDGSRDDSPKIIENVLRDCPFDSELIVRPNRGLCATLNEGFALSSGEYFAYLGSDDFWLPTFFEERVRMLERRPEAVLGYGHAFLVDGDGRTFDSTARYTHDWADYPDGDPRLMLVRGISPISSTIFYRRTALAGVAWNEDSRLEDYEMYLKLMTRGEFAFDTQVLSAWRHHSYNTSGNLRLMLSEIIEAQRRNAASLGVTDRELKAIQTKTRFRYARDFLQHGDKRGAYRLAKESWRGAASGAELARFTLRMLVPMSIVNLRRRLSGKPETPAAGNNNI
jgi:alpha-1,3-rhamnosyltransferase